MRRLLDLLVVAVFFFGAAGCASPSADSIQTTSPEDYSPPQFVQYSIRWSASRGIDLLSAPAVIVRAFSESADIAASLDPIYGYPGFADQVSPPEEFQGFNNISATPKQVAAQFGTLYFHLLSLDRQSSSGYWSAVVCKWTAGLAFDTPNSRTYGTAASRNSTPSSLTAAPPRDGVDWPTRFGSGTERYPITDVFGDWEIVDAKVTDRGNQAACDSVNDPAIPADVRHPIPNRTLQTPLPTFPSYPGWTAGEGT